MYKLRYRCMYAAFREATPGVASCAHGTGGNITKSARERERERDSSPSLNAGAPDRAAGEPSTNKKKTEWKRDAHTWAVFTRGVFLYLPSRRYVLVVPFYAISVTIVKQEKWTQNAKRVRPLFPGKIAEHELHGCMKQQCACGRNQGNRLQKLLR